MGGLLLVGLFILLAIRLWPFLLAALLAYLLWRCVLVPMREAQAREVRERLRHEQARREIDRIATQTTQAMYAAARQNGDVIEGRAE
jgi:peptidoglycan/LPS O-acetylase OafA/YrhL